MKHLNRVLLMSVVSLSLAMGSAEAAPQPSNQLRLVEDRVLVPDQRASTENASPMYLIYQPLNMDIPPVPLPRPRPAYLWDASSDAQAFDDFSEPDIWSALEEITIPVDFTLGGVVLRWATVF